MKEPAIDTHTHAYIYECKRRKILKKILVKILGDSFDKKCLSCRDDFDYMSSSSSPLTHPSSLRLLICPKMDTHNINNNNSSNSNPAQQQPHQQHKRKCRNEATTTKSATTCCSYSLTCPQTRPLTRLLALAVLLSICSFVLPIEALQPGLTAALDNFTGDNRKPAFINCAGYAPSVKEEQPENTYVFTVKAVDPDPDQEILYSLVESSFDRAKFTIVPTSGVIKTAHTFDRDEPIHEKFVFVTVQATDNGRPPLDDVCTFNVTIEDINDNPPVFNKAHYDENMSENTQVSAGNTGKGGRVISLCYTQLAMCDQMCGPWITAV